MMTGIEGSTSPDGLCNFRDLGGIPTSSGEVKPGRLYRSDALAALTDTGRTQLAHLPIRLIIDLRSRTEAQLAPIRLSADSTAEVLPLPLLDGNIAEPVRRVPPLDEIYENLLDHAGDTFAAVARAVADTDGATVIQCTAGKDRTGLAVAIALLSIGADEEAVINDYALSEAKLSGPWRTAMLENLTRDGTPIPPGLEPVLSAAPPAALRRVIRLLEEAHGGAAAYLGEHGADAAVITRLTRALAA